MGRRLCRWQGRVDFGVSRVQWFCMDAERNRAALHQAQQAAGHSSPNTTANPPPPIHTVPEGSPIAPQESIVYGEGKREEVNICTKKKPVLFKIAFHLFQWKMKGTEAVWCVISFAEIFPGFSDCAFKRTLKGSGGDRQRTVFGFIACWPVDVVRSVSSPLPLALCVRTPHRTD